MRPGDLARITIQLSDDELFSKESFGEEQSEDANLWLGEWSEFLRRFYDQDESVFS